ncbi:ABC transporter substrate-binding protein [Enterobacterales bacterium]|nr:ABC transporter substrate-binding protein [Enterobacterales bacterium]
MINRTPTSLKTGLITAMTLSLAMATGSAHALTLYTAGPGSLAKKLAAGYEKQTGVKVDVFQATTGKVMARLDAEQANPRADILISASWDTATDLQKRGWLLEYQSPNATEVPAQFKTPYYVAQGISALGIVWNTKSGTPEPQDWSDLAKPAFKDKVTTPDPALSGASLDLLIGLQNAHAQQAWTLFDELKANGMIIAGPNAQALTPVLQGAKAAVFGAVDYVAYSSVQDGEAIKVIFPASGTVIAPRPMMILKSSKEQKEAKAFIDYALSDEGQKLVAEAWLMPARTDISAKRPLFKTLKLLPEETQPSASRKEVLDRFASLFGQR